MWPLPPSFFLCSQTPMASGREHHEGEDYGGHHGRGPAAAGGVHVGGLGVAGADRCRGARARAQRGASRGVPSVAAGRGHRAVRGGRRGRHGSQRG